MFINMVEETQKIDKKLLNPIKTEEENQNNMLNLLISQDILRKSLVLVVSPKRYFEF